MNESLACSQKFVKPIRHGKSFIFFFSNSLSRFRISLKFHFGWYMTWEFFFGKASSGLLDLSISHFGDFWYSHYSLFFGPIPWCHTTQIVPQNTTLHWTLNPIFIFRHDGMKTENFDRNKKSPHSAGMMTKPSVNQSRVANCNLGVWPLFSFVNCISSSVDGKCC